MSRERFLQELCEVIRLKFPSASVNAFGSFAADLSIFLSDLDVSIVFPSPETPSNLDSRRVPEPCEPVVSSEEEEEDLQQRKEEGTIIKLDKPVNQHLYLDIWEEGSPNPPPGDAIVYLSLDLSVSLTAHSQRLSR